MFGMTAPAVAQNVGTVLNRGDQLNPDDFIEVTWPGGTYWLIMQLDGNLVLYKGDRDHHVTKVCWASNTAGRGWNSVYAKYQGQDGNFVLYTFSGFAIWASNTVGVPGNTVDVSGRGRLFVGTKRISGDC
ncbi:hypothetical protein Acy02nite_89850 [Actinoplanes cyaneus]|uniref:Bulb-type lectin domain-containing protein n=2 Tax=Actinoplanes cyaneus TaxID=52696 RepID=A0A919MCW7_9ACTN|nr:hypothetical protein Acy02nite_89850 [Actinoplanes cyaneus]